MMMLRQLHEGGGETSCRKSAGRFFFTVLSTVAAVGLLVQQVGGITLEGEEEHVDDDIDIGTIVQNTNMIPNATDNVTFFDMDAALKMELKNTTEYNRAYEEYPAPLNITLIADELKALVDECSANVTGPLFCNTCVRPVMRLELRAYLSTMLADAIPDDLSAAAQVAVYDRIGEQILTFMEEQGMPVDGFFYANVVFCSLHTEDPVCVAPPAELHAVLDPVLDSCLRVQDHMHRLHRSGNRQSTEAYCTLCYWPFITTMINHGLSDQFWCQHRGLLNISADRPENETALADLLYADDSFVACMENARSEMLQNRVDVFDPTLTDDIREGCWEDDLSPRPGSILSPENRRRVLDMSCPEEPADPTIIEEQD